MKRYLFILSIITPILFTGCLRTYYPAVYQSSASPMVFETNNAATESGKYQSVDLTISKGDYKNESLQLLRGSYLIVNTREYLNTNTRLFGYGGIYNVAGVEKYDGNFVVSYPKEFNGSKSFLGAGGEFGLNLNFKIYALKIGVGFTAGFTAELGDYYNFRKKAASQGLIKSEQGFVFLSFTAFPILAYEISEKTVISSQLNIGFPGFISPSLILNNDGSVYWLSWFPDSDDRNNILGHRLSIGFITEVNKFNLGF